MGRWGTQHCLNQEQQAGPAEQGNLRGCLCPFSTQFAPSSCNPSLRDGTFLYQKCGSVWRGPLDM